MYRIVVTTDDKEKVIYGLSNRGAVVKTCLMFFFQ